MIHLVILLLIGLAAPARAQSAAFDTELLAGVQTEAIDFMIPRTLDPVSAAQLALWGLGGLTAADPALVVVVRDKTLRLLFRGRNLAEAAAPAPDAPTAAWGQTIAGLAAAGFAASPSLRQAGQAALTKILFDDMLAHLDPYTRYIPPLEALDDRDRRVGRAGIGLTLFQRGRAVMVRDVVIGSPGALAGMVPGDTVLTVDGKQAAGRARAALETMLNGPEGTDIRLGWRSRDGGSQDMTLTRVMVPPETVFPRRNGDVLIVQITGFTQTTDQHVAQVIRDGMKGPKPLAGIVLDLRGNRGGVLRTAIATANTFLSKGVIVRSSGRAPETNRVWLSGGGELAAGVRMAILVDGGTASAAEVLAAALSDRGRAVVIGSATFGKGLVQTIDPLPDGGELFLTWSRLLAPRGWPIQSLGVLPQICTSRGDDFVRRQLAALAAGEMAMGTALAIHRGARAPMTPDQIVAVRETCPAADPQATDATLAEALVRNPREHAAALLGLFAGEP